MQKYHMLKFSRASPKMASENIKYLVRAKGSPFVATHTPKPTLVAATEVMIRLKAIAINPADCKMIDQGHRGTSWPLVPGLDGAGIVEAVGNDVKSFAIGDGALAMFTAGDRAGSFQNFAVVEEVMVAKKPMTWSFEEAATLGCVVLSHPPLLPFIFSLLRVCSVDNPKA
jgi:NADPH:quinone reductase-like Zn-dependent oxidoreductase